MDGTSTSAELRPITVSPPGSSMVGPPSLGDVETAAVSPHGWRLSDGRRPLGDPFRLLAFIERRGDAFEVMQLGAGFEWHEFESFEAAIASVIETGPRLTRERQGESE